MAVVLLKKLTMSPVPDWVMVKAETYTDGEVEAEEELYIDTGPLDKIPPVPTIKPPPILKSLNMLAFSQTSKGPTARSPMVAAGASIPEMSKILKESSG